MANSNEKGADFERQVCQKLSLWVSEYTREDVYWRAAMSGGRANLPHRRARRDAFSGQCGDISAVDALGHHLLSLFVIECKFNKTVQFQQACFGRESAVIFSHWDQVYQEAKSLDKLPMLMVKQNRQPEIVGLTKEGLRILQSGASKKLRVLCAFPSIRLRFILTKDMLTLVKYSLIRELYE